MPFLAQDVETPSSPDAPTSFPTRPKLDVSVPLSLRGLRLELAAAEEKLFPGWFTSLEA